MTTDFDIRFAIDPVSAGAMNTDELREHFLIEELFTLGGINWTYTHYDRMAVGGAVPARSITAHRNPMTNAVWYDAARA